MPTNKPQIASPVPFFDARHLPEPDRNYVCWVDVMGTKAVMSRSSSMAANFVCKLHGSVLGAPRGKAVLYPMMDGVYITSADRGEMENMLRAVFIAQAELFIGTAELHHRFAVRAGIAFGPVVHGDTIPGECSWTLNRSPEYKKSILLGILMVQAFESETHASPFGVHAHESARAFAPAGQEPFHQAWWQWWTREDQGRAEMLGAELKKYFEWCRNRSHALGYDAERIAVHSEMARQYFCEASERKPSAQK